MNTTDKIAVCSRSFSRHPILRAELLARYSQVTFNETGRQMDGDELVAFLRGHDKAITALERMDDCVLASLPELKVIGKYGVGLDMIDLNAMRQYGKRLGWVKGVNRRSVAELTLAFAIVMLRHVPAANREVLAGTWRQLTGGLLTGRTVGIIGCGNVGQDLVRLLQPFNCPILVNDINDYSDFYAEYNIEVVTKEALLERADVVTLHVPLDDSTYGMLSQERIALMKSASVLINVARGGVVDESALKRALIEKRIAAAAFDVFANEPPQDVELLHLPNFLVTPHIGGSAEEAILAMGRSAIEGLEFNEVP
jgi:D-3-phosphoglycerate dehydrogenase